MSPTSLRPNPGIPGLQNPLAISKVKGPSPNWIGSSSGVHPFDERNSSLCPTNFPTPSEARAAAMGSGPGIAVTGSAEATLAADTRGSLPGIQTISNETLDIAQPGNDFDISSQADTLPSAADTTALQQMKHGIAAASGIVPGKCSNCPLRCSKSCLGSAIEMSPSANGSHVEMGPFASGNHIVMNPNVGLGAGSMVLNSGVFDSLMGAGLMVPNAGASGSCLNAFNMNSRHVFDSMRVNSDNSGHENESNLNSGLHQKGRG